MSQITKLQELMSAGANSHCGESALKEFTRDDILEARDRAVKKSSNREHDVTASNSSPYAEASFDAGLFHSTLVELGMGTLSQSETDDVFLQILKARGPDHESEESPQITVADVLEWMDTIVALGNFSKHRIHGNDDAVDHELLSRNPSTRALSSKLDDPLSGAVSPATSCVQTRNSSMSQPGTVAGDGVLLPQTLLIEVPAAGSSAHAVDENVKATTTSAAKSPSETDEQRRVLLNFITTAMPSMNKDPETVMKDLEQRGVLPFIRSMISNAAVNPSLTLDDFVDKWHSVEAEAAGVTTSRKSSTGGRKSSLGRERSISFSSALALQHVGTSAEATMSIRAALLFVDISGYSAVTSAIENQGAHALSAIVNGYFQKIVDEIHHHGGDVVKYAGDALLALWYTGNDLENVQCAVRCSHMLQKRCGRESVPGTTLSLQIHCGASFGRVTSRIFSPRKLRSNDTPSHFHFLTGEPLYDVSRACSAAGKGENVLHGSAVEILEQVMSSEHLALLNPIEGATHALYNLPFNESVENVVRLWAKAERPKKLTLPRGGVNSNVENQMLFIPPRVGQVLASGMDQFFMAEMRKLVVLFIHFGGSTDVEVWFDEVFHVLESFGCDVVQIIDDDKGIHIVAAFNLYLMAEESVDAAIQLCRSLEAKHCESHVGVATGTVFCGVIGAAEACQWDISGQACVRAARLMQHASANNISAVIDASVFEEAIDRSSLRALEPIDIKGSANPVDVYTLQHESQLKHARASRFAMDDRVPALHFSQSLCPKVHIKIIEEIRKLLHLFPPVPKQFKYLLDKSDETAGDNTAVALQSARQQSSRFAGTPVNALDRSPTYSRSDSFPERVRLVVLSGTQGTGKFSAALNCLREAQAVPIVHRCYERHLLMPLTVVHTLSSWFICSQITSIRHAAQSVLTALHEHRQNEAFTAGMQMMATVIADSPLRYAIVVRAGHFLDQSSVSFLGALSTQFAHAVDKLSMLVTCTPLFGYPDPEKRYLALGHARGFKLDSISDTEVDALLAHCLKQPGDEKLLAFVCRKTNKYVECIVELSRYLVRRGVIVINNDGTAHVTDKKTAEIEKMLWGDISETIRLKAIHVLDHLTPELLTMCKIIAAITEQPLISAFFYSVSKVCEELNNAKLNVDDVKTLDRLWLLKMCEHKCTAHTGNGELDAAVFLVPAMRDIVQSLLVPQQRVAINQICGDCYAETHPMDHPMQFLVRARHYLFAGMDEEYTRDMKQGWKLLTEQGSRFQKDLEVIENRFLDWMSEIDPSKVNDVLHQNEALIRRFRLRHARHAMASKSSLTGYSPFTQRASRSSMSMAAASASVLPAGTEFMVLSLMQKLAIYRLPIEMAPARIAFQDLIECVQQLMELVGDNLVSVGNIALFEEEDKTAAESIMDSIVDSVRSYTTVLNVSVRHASQEIRDLVCAAGEGMARRVDAVASERAKAPSETQKAATASVALVAINETLELSARSDEPASPSRSTSSEKESQQRVREYRTKLASILELIQTHTTSDIPKICEALCKDWEAHSQSAYNTTVVIRRRIRYTSECALSGAVTALLEDRSSVERGDVIVSLFENLSRILENYAADSHRLQQCFCDGLEEFYRGTLQPPQTYDALRQKTTVFFFSWLNCCAQHLMFR